MAVRDVIVTYRGELSERQMVGYSRCITLVFGILTLFAALRYQSVIDILLYADGFWDGTVSIPLMASILGYKSSRYAFARAAITGAVVVTGWLILDLEQRWGIYSLLPGMLVNSVVFFGANAYSKRKGIYAREQEHDRVVGNRVSGVTSMSEKIMSSASNDDLPS
jgi:Na+/pantothenate symporter